MRTKKVSRYWCDYCNKAGLSKSAMERHEKHCTLNPERSCRVCNLVQGGSHGLPMSELVALLPDSKPYHTAAPFDDKEHQELHAALEVALPALREAVSGCPACIMAALRQANIPVPMAESFDFNKEMKSIFDDLNEERFQCAAY
jgi:hypothetical protein